MLCTDGDFAFQLSGLCVAHHYDADSPKQDVLASVQRDAVNNALSHNVQADRAALCEHCNFGAVLAGCARPDAAVAAQVGVAQRSNRIVGLFEHRAFAWLGR